MGAYCISGTHEASTRLPDFPTVRMSAAFPGQERAKHMGELKRGDRRWDVYLETQPDGELGAVRGRIHFVGPEQRLMTGWVFLEWSEPEVRERFGEFSAVELWHFLEGLGGGA